MQGARSPSQVSSQQMPSKNINGPIKWLKQKSKKRSSKSKQNGDDGSVCSQSYSIATNQTPPASHMNFSPNQSIASIRRTSEETLQKKLSEMHSFMEHDQVLEARKILDEIEMLENSNPLNPRISEGRHLTFMRDVKERSDYVRYFLGQFCTDEGWTFASQKRGVRVDIKQVPDSTIFLTRSQTMFENFTAKDFIRIVSLYEESDLMPRWFPRGLMKSATCLRQVSKYSKILHFELTFPKLSLLDNRDAVIEARGYHLVDENAVIIISRSIDESALCQVPLVDKNTVRADILTAIMIEFLPGNRVIYRNLERVNLKLKFIPVFLTNLLAKGVIPFEEIAAIKKSLQSFDGSKWQSRIKQRRPFYTDLEDRVIKEARNKFRRMSGTNFAFDNNFYSLHNGQHYDLDSDEDNHKRIPPPQKKTWQKVTFIVVLICLFVFLSKSCENPAIRQFLKSSGQTLEKKFKGLKAKADVKSKRRTNKRKEKKRKKTNISGRVDGEEIPAKDINLKTILSTENEEVMKTQKLKEYCTPEVEIPREDCSSTSID